jgi:hypothetical protein
MKAALFYAFAIAFLCIQITTSMNVDRLIIDSAMERLVYYRGFLFVNYVHGRKVCGK